MPSKVLFTFPGKIGDTLHQWPIARQWAEENGTKIEVGLANQLQPLAGLLLKQPCVERLHLLPGIENFDIGGQPWDFGWGASKRHWDEVFHLGFRQFPARGLMRETYDLVPLKTSFEDIWSQPSIEPFWVGPNGNKPVILHGNKSRPAYYKALIRCLPTIAKAFDPIVWAGRPDEWPLEAETDKHGEGLPLEDVAERIARSALVFAASSSIAALAGAQGAPCLRIGEENLTPDSIWNNPGTLQFQTTGDPLRELNRVLKEEPWRAKVSA